MRRRYVIGAVLVVLGAGTVSAQSANSRTSEKEPEYDGRPLSEWIKDFKAAAPQTRNAAAYAISGMGPAARSAVPVLIEALEDPSPTVRFPVCIALREIGPEAAAAVPALEKVLLDPSDDVAAMARKALKAITGRDPVPPDDD